MRDGTEIDQSSGVNALERALTTITGTLLAYYGAKRRGVTGAAMAIGGAALIRKGVRGERVPTDTTLRINRAVTVNLPKEEVFRFWRDLENLPRFMKHLKSVKVTGPTSSHWVMNAPGGRTVEWDSEIVREAEGETIAWRSLAGSRVRNSGRVLFEDAAGERGTVIRVSLAYGPPGGALGGAIAKLVGINPGDRVAEDLRRMKSILEAGQVANSPKTSGAKEHRAAEKRIHEASENSFPASDAPTYR